MTPGLSFSTTTRSLRSDPRARRISHPLLPGVSGGFGGSKSSDTSDVVASVRPVEAFAEIVAAPSAAFGPGTTTRHSGEAAITSASSPLIRTRSASASPRNPPPQIEKWSREDTTGETVITGGTLAATCESTSAATEVPDACAIRNPPDAGTVKKARPVASLSTRSPFPSSTATWAASLPSTPRVASVAGAPAASFGGSTRVTAHAVDDPVCACAYAGSAAAPAKRETAAHTPNRMIFERRLDAGAWSMWRHASAKRERNSKVSLRNGVGIRVSQRLADYSSNRTTKVVN